MNKKIKITLFISLALNLVLAGFVGGYLFGHKKPMKGMKDFGKREEAMINSLPESKREEAKEILKQSKEARFKGFKETKSLLAEIEKITIAEKFDQEKFLDHLEKFDDRISDSKEESNEAIAKFLGTLNKEERVKLVEEIKKNHRLFPKDRDEKEDFKSPSDKK